MQPLAVYLHIPFCARKCNYCDFLSAPAEESEIERYLEALHREIVLQGPLLSERGVRTVYFGGGTPSLLEPDQLADLLHRILPDPGLALEITLEANPGTVDSSRLARLREAGFNRLSLGIQSLRERELQLLGRIHSAQEAKDAIRLAHAAGFENIGADIIFGLPGQTRGDLMLTLMEVLGLHPTHLSLYALTLEPHTPLARQVRRGTLSLPAEDDVADLYQAACDLLEGDGFEHYEISNFALPGFRSEHNQVYWHSGDYLGLGLGSVSFLDGFRRKNLATLDEYDSRLEQSELPIGQQLGKRGMAAMREEIIMHLRTNDGFSEEDLRARYPRAFPRMRERLEKLREEGSLLLEDGCWRLNPELYFVSNQVFVKLI